jgi:DNA mismatch repair protein MutS
MGKRLLKYRITNPITDINELNYRYDLIDKFINENEIVSYIIYKLKEIGDIERYTRKINLKILYPYEILNIFISIESIISIFDKINNKFIIDNELITKIKKFKNECEKIFNLNIIGKYNNNNIDNSFFNKNIYEEIDIIQEDIDNIYNFFDKESKYLSDLIEKDSNFVKYEYNERDGYFMYLTTKRADILKSKLKKEYEFKKYSGNNLKIVSNNINKKSDKLILLKEKIKNVVKDYFLKTLNSFDNEYSDCLKECSKIIALIDVMISNIQCAILYKYNKPVIINNDNNHSYFKGDGVRHAIIERLDNSGIYIGNDVYLNNEDNLGFLLYGVNGVGKSSLGKAVGLVIIMAQMGMYVPCDSLEFYPYSKLFTRINGDDNIFKGMSSFVLEMNELKSILKYADSNSIILGDEICKGTEEISALSIISSCIQHFSKNKINFIMATHFHKLSELECIKSLNNIKYKYLSIEYDEFNDMIIYGRKLCDGVGSNLYGLEIAKYILKNDDFINNAMKIRKEILNIDTITGSKFNDFSDTSICYYLPPFINASLITEQSVFFILSIFQSINKSLYDK